MIKYEMQATSAATNPPPKILVYSEDAEARWLLKGLLKDYLAMHISINEKVSLGVKEYMRLIEGDPIYFNNILLVLDGDAHNDEDVTRHIESSFNNITLLPGQVRPEQVIRDFLKSLPPEDEYLNRHEVRELGINHRYWQEEQLQTGTAPEREQYKTWFRQYLPLFESTNLLDYWMLKNKEAVEIFRSNFIDNFNKIAARKNMRKIQK